MPFEKYFDESNSTAQPACIHLRSKAMYTTGDLKNPDHPDEAGSHYCWCNVTQHVIGVDRQDVDRSRCIPGRQCYQQDYDV
jgi:hypothetical protein